MNATAQQVGTTLPPDITAKRKEENFPVASWLLGREHTAAILDFYRFARYADEISDDPSMLAKQKECLLHEAETALHGPVEDAPEWMRPYLQKVRTGAYHPAHGQALLSAFTQDVTKTRYQSWEELLDYCQRSAAPVGRAVLEVHREWDADIAASDALCHALQILNHVQDVTEDYRDRDRVYIPGSWLENVALLGGERMSPEVHEALNHVLAETALLLNKAEALPGTVRGWRIRAEICTILAIAKALLRKLRKKDPLVEKVRLPGWRKGMAVIQGMAVATYHASGRFFGGVEQVEEGSAKKAGSSFLWPMLRLSPRKREAMMALYAMCRVLDDAADDTKNAEEAKVKLNFWQAECVRLRDPAADYPQHAVSRALLPHMIACGWDIGELQKMLAALTLDAEGSMVRPSLDTLERYCDGVAGTVGRLSVRVFGYTQEQKTVDFAGLLGQALQRINILRDVQVDAIAGRIYLPQEWLNGAGCGEITPGELVEMTVETREVITPVCVRLADDAQKRLNEARAKLPEEDWQNMRPALQMAAVYEALLRKIIAADYGLKQSTMVKLTRGEKLGALRSV